VTGDAQDILVQRVVKALVEERKEYILGNKTDPEE
jgi:hypothetical protein